MKQQINKAPFLIRFIQYQNERFPIIVHGLLISIFTFSAISYSRICRGAAGFISMKDFLVGIFATVSLFFLVRIFDEFKDREDDARFRSYLPVPRGLISLKELRNVGLVTAALQLIVLIWFQPRMLWLYMIVIGYLLLMGVEFFVPQWLKARQIIYVTSHMFIIPLVDVYSTGLDWGLEDATPSLGLLFFFAVSYMNGLVLEFGRKIRAPHKEEEGVVSYTGMYGTKGGTMVWLGTLLVTLIISLIASGFAGYGILGYGILIGFFILCAIPAILFLQNHTESRSKMIEYASGLWTAAMYLTLGGVPMLNQLLFG